MKKLLVTGGTVFVSRYIAEYYVAKGWEVYVLNRNTREQSKGVHLIEADRHDLGEKLRAFHFDLVVDTAYTAKDVEMLLDAIGSYDDYVLISSSAVYPEYGVQPFKEEDEIAVNKYWGAYGTNKIEAEALLTKRDANAYIFRPPYIYGQMNNVYREAFVFDYALQDRNFYLPKDGDLKLQFFHVDDLCRFIDVLLEKRPANHIFNVGNKEVVSVREWVESCYKVLGKTPKFVNVYKDVDQRNYFSFYNYEYYLDVTKQYELLGSVKPFEEGLKEAFAWYQEHEHLVMKKPLLEYIDKELRV